ATSTYLVNKVTSYLDFIFAIACFLLDLTKPHCSRRAAIQKLDFYWQLELTTPTHGERPFEIVHIDHTQLDIELVSSLQNLSNCHLDIGDTKYKNLGRPWATFMVDAYSRRLLAIYLTFEEPSYRSILMVIRICVMRFKRFPQTIVVDNGAEFHSHYFEQLLATYACTKKHRPPAYPRFGSVVERLFGTANTQLIYELLGNTQLTTKHRCVTKSVSPSKQAVWTLIDLYSALLSWGYEVYDQREHPALGQTPSDAFNVGIAFGGSRLHRRVEYDNIFRILTLPAPQQTKRKVQPGQGVKIHNIYYWNNEFRNPEIEFTSVDVRYDPWDAGIAYALVQGQWVECISKYYQYFKGRSEKEIQLVSAELLVRKRLQGHNFINSDRELVQFLNSVELTEEKLLLQRLKNAENKNVLQLIEDVSTTQCVSHQPNSAFQTNSSEENLLDPENNYLETDKLIDVKNNNLESLEYYGEF
ncbi:DDE-type integrase/transposase/recombinase, partial [Nostoc sp. FACHB-133]|uniref:DDE-type integrase/transposase/recombinase n=1 Tax=Nostoc sp. FACHB-133 TaxID=2692835 RepID=UPI0016850F0C